MIEGSNKKGSDTLGSRLIMPDDVFNILFLGGPGVGKSLVINRVSRVSSFPNIR
jgi:GTPase SAR1 family protein